MLELPHILANDNDVFGKLVVAVIVLVFIGIQKIAKLANDANKSANQNGKRSAPPVRQQRPVVTSTRQNQQRPAVMQQRQPIAPPMGAGAIPLPALAKKIAKPARAVRKQRIPAVPQQAVQVAPAASASTSQSTPAGAVTPTARKGPRVNARGVRSQFIMMEVMKPPLSLR